MFTNIIRNEKCIVETTVLAIMLNSSNSIVLHLGYKNKNYYRYQKMFFDMNISTSQTDYHCWLTFNDKPVITPFYESLWTKIYSYKIGETGE